MTFAARLEEILVSRGMTKSDLARELDLEPQSVGQWGRGVKPTMPVGKRLAVIAQILGVTAAELMEPPGTPFGDQKSQAGVDLADGGEPRLGYPIKDHEELALIGTWKKLPEEDKNLLRAILDNLRLRSGIIPTKG